MLPDAVIEFAGEPADDGFVAGVGEAETTGGETAEMGVGGDDDCGFAHAAGLDGGDDGGGGAAVDDDVGVFG